MANNRTFFKKVQTQDKMSLGDIFSDVFRKHRSEDAARVFIAGTELTTPKTADMLSGWQKPFLFARLFVAGLATILLMAVLAYLLNYTPAIFLMCMVIAVIVDLSVLLLIFEMHIPRSISLMEVLEIVFIGGALSLIATLVIHEFIPVDAAVWAGLVEEPAKLLVLCLLLKRKNYRYILDGILLGFAVGTGFATMENLVYTFSEMFTEGLTAGVLQAIVRALTAISGHGLYAGLFGGALVLVKGAAALQPKHLVHPSFLMYFAISILLHAFNNLGVDLGLPRFLGGLINLQWVLVTVVAIAVFLPFLRRGVNEIVKVSAAANGGRVSMAVNRDAMAPMDRPTPGSASASLQLEGLGQAVGHSCTLRHGLSQVTIGRSRGEITLPQCSNVSGTHCRVWIDNDRAYVMDLGSTNGTWLGNQKLVPQQPMPVNNGDTIWLGNQNCGFRIHKQ